MIELTSIDKFEIVGRGMVYYVETNENLFHHIIKLDGKEVFVTGQEGWPRFGKLGLTVRPVTIDNKHDQRHQDYKEFQAWQAAQVMNLVFGNEYVPIPPIPKGYENYSQHWWDSQIRICGRDKDWGWHIPCEPGEKRIPAL